jgi:hypothetical protein
MFNFDNHFLFGLSLYPAQQLTAQRHDINKTLSKASLVTIPGLLSNEYACGKINDTNILPKKNGYW